MPGPDGRLVRPMRDRDIEQQLEDWLSEEARPIPQSVLESSLEAVSRTSQAGRRPVLRWLTASRLGVPVIATSVVLLAVATALTIDRIGSLVSSPPAGPTATPGLPLYWDATADFGRWSNERNPAPDAYGNQGVWSYMSSTQAHDPAYYRLLPTFARGIWRDSLGEVQGYLDKSNVILTPGVSRRYVLLRWTSPVDARIRISGFVLLVNYPCGGVASGITFFVDHDAQQLATEPISTGSARAIVLETIVRRGESLYFVVDRDTDNLCDSTLISLEIVSEGA